MIGYTCQSMPHRDSARRSFSYLFIVRLGVGGRGYDMVLALCYAFDFAMIVVR